MKTILVADAVYDRVALLVRAWRISEGEVVGRLLDEFLAEESRPDSPDPADDGVPIHTVYDGNRIDAVYHSTTKRIDIMSGVLAGHSYKSPSGAAIGVVQAHNPSVHPNRNGWSFWTITESGELLQSIRPR